MPECPITLNDLRRPGVIPCVCNIHQARECKTCCQYCPTESRCARACPDADGDVVCYQKRMPTPNGPVPIYLYTTEKAEGDDALGRRMELSNALLRRTLIRK